jgi:hypothetical protein
MNNFNIFSIFAFSCFNLAKGNLTCSFYRRIIHSFNKIIQCFFKAQSLYSDTIASYRLNNAMFKKPSYDPWIRPVINESTVTNISLSLSLSQLIQIVSIKEIICLK